MGRSPIPRRSPWGLKGRLVGLTLVVGAVPLLLGIGMAYVQGTRELQTVIGSSFAGLAAETARSLDRVFGEEIARTARIAGDRAVIAGLKTPRVNTDSKSDERRWEAKDPALIQDLTAGPIADRLRRYANLGGEDTQPSTRRAPTLALALTDAEGRLVASVNGDARYANQNELWWRTVRSEGPDRSYLGGVFFDERWNRWVFDLAIPVVDSPRGRALGVLHRVFDVEGFLQPMLAPIRFGRTGHVMLIDSAGVVILCPILPTGARLADAELIRLVTLPESGWAETPSDGHGGRTESIVGFSPLQDTSRLTLASTGKAWHTFAWQSSEELFASTRSLFTWISIFGVVAIGLLGTLGYVAAARIVTPIRRLQEGAALIGRNELKEPIVVRTGDEIEQLADEINRMNARLQRAFSGLTQEVEEKTQEVRSLQEYNERILDSVPNPIIMLDEERVQYANRATNEAFHLNSERARGAKLFDLIAMDAASCEQLRGSLRAYAKGWEGATDATDRMTTAAGSWPLPADPLSPQQLVESEHARRELTIDRQTYRYELFHIGGQSAGKRWIGLMLRDATGESRLQDELIQAEKLAGLGVLTSGIGHELNNPLFGILSLGEAIRDEKDAVRMKEHAKEIVGHAKRMAGIIQDFAGSARSDGSDLRDDVNVNEQLDLALRVVGLTDAVAGLQVRRHYRPVPKIRAVPEEIGQAFVSLITNAIQAMKGKGTIDLITELSQDTIVVRVRDSGPGIPKAYVSKIFDPFFTTKAPGQGTGLGLTMTRRIVLKHGGYIHVETAEGRGATFVLIFPASDTAAE